MSTAQHDTLKRSAMASGRFVDPWNVRPSDIHIEDIARGLANINRFNGQFGQYSVAQHSIYVSIIVPWNQALAGLLHDAPEYITGDLAHHIKRGNPYILSEWTALDNPIQYAVEDRYGLERGSLYSDVVKAADEEVFDREWEHFVKRQGGGMPAWSPVYAEQAFLDRFRCYTEAT